MSIQPYLFFEGRCDEAIAFYQKAANAEVQMLMRFRDAPAEAQRNSRSADKVMHASLRVGQSVVMMSDGRCGGSPAFGGFALSLTVTDVAEAQRVFAALADGGQVGMALAKTFFSPQFGMLTDRFGVMWMVMVDA